MGVSADPTCRFLAFSPAPGGYMDKQNLEPRENETQQAEDKQEYQAPDVRDLGTVQDLTQTNPLAVGNDAVGAAPYATSV